MKHAVLVHNDLDRRRVSLSLVQYWRFGGQVGEMGVIILHSF